MDKKKLLTWMTLGASGMALAIFRKMMRNTGKYDRGKDPRTGQRRRVPILRTIYRF